MPQTASGLDGVTPDGFLLVLAIAVPAVAAMAAFALGGRHIERIAFAAIAVGLAIAGAIFAAVLRTGASAVYHLGGWAPPLGVALRADGLAAAMALAAAVLIAATGLYARADFRTPPGAPEARASFAFWILLLGVWAGLNTVFLTGDLFTGFVALELLTFSAVPLVCLDGRAETLQAALRYLLFALIGSMLYLVGTGLLLGAYGTLDIVLLSERVRPDPATYAAAALMTVGLLAKTALFPLHLWLPPAHAGAPPAASAVLSALVIKGSFFLVVRLWFDVMPGLPGYVAAQLLAALGAGAILFGSAVALRQVRLKLLIAYSTVAQIGYLFLMFPLAFNPASAQIESGVALTAGMVQAISHATAKAAMFMAAGSMYVALGHDRIAGLAGIGRALPMSVWAFGLGGISLVGLPPSGGFAAKWLLLAAAVGTGQWWWALVVMVGGLLTAGYVFLVLAHALRTADEPVMLLAPVSRSGEAVALALAVCAALLGLAALDPTNVLLIGRLPAGPGG
jgi:formate hydrogenlyase subunit 3/multisubunit Na+/H+ antiporter MnhD subunit